MKKTALLLTMILAVQITNVSGAVNAQKEKREHIIIAQKEKREHIIIAQKEKREHIIIASGEQVMVEDLIHV